MNETERKALKDWLKEANDIIDEVAHSTIPPDQVALVLAKAIRPYHYFKLDSAGGLTAPSLPTQSSIPSPPAGFSARGARVRVTGVDTYLHREMLRQWGLKWDDKGWWWGYVKPEQKEQFQIEMNAAKLQAVWR